MEVWRMAALKAALAVVLCGAAPPASLGQSRDVADVLTLDGAVAIALQANPKLDNAQLDYQKATDGLAAAKTHLLPTLRADVLPSYNLSEQSFTYQPGTFGIVPGYGPFPATEVQIPTHSGVTTVAGASVVQPIIQLYRIGLTVDQHQVQQSMAEQQVRAQRQDLVKQVKQQYYAILSTQSSLAATEESIAFYKELSELVDRYVKERVALEYQALETKSRLARSQHKARTERNALATQSERLNVLLGRDVRTKFRVAQPADAVPPGMTPESAEQAALAQRPDVLQARLKLQHAETDYRIKRSEYLPDLNLAMRYSRLFNVDLIPDQVWTVGLELRWEFWDWGRKSQQLGQKTADIAQARNDIRDVESQVRVEVDARLRELEEAAEYVKVTQLAQAAAREKLRVTMNLYKQRSALLKDVLQAESELADANSEYFKAVMGLASARANLDKALGEG
jgi:outer membrane protein TolC